MILTNTTKSQGPFCTGTFSRSVASTANAFKKKKANIGNLVQRHRLWRTRPELQRLAGRLMAWRETAAWGCMWRRSGVILPCAAHVQSSAGLQLRR